MSLPVVVTLGPLATADADFFVLSATPVSGTAYSAGSRAPFDRFSNAHSGW